MASDYPFQKIIGVEFSAESPAAQRNASVTNSPDQKCRKIQSVLAMQQPTRFRRTGVYYFYNRSKRTCCEPCTATFRRLCARGPACLYFYYNPVYREVFDVAESYLDPGGSDYCINVSIDLNKYPQRKRSLRA